jgi:hypothetical protein
MKRKYLRIIIIFFLLTNIAYANLEISEIMYAPEKGADYEWVEIYNNSLDSIDLNKYRFFHGQNSGPLTLRKGNSYILGPYNYALITKSSKDYSWLDVPNMVLSSSVLSLPDKGDNTYIAISDPNKNIITEIRYDPSKGGSKMSKSSLAIINGTWKNGIPTPGSENKEMKISQIEGTKNSNQEKPIILNNNGDVANSLYTDEAEEKIINLNQLNPNEARFKINISKSSHIYIGLIIVVMIGMILFILVRNKYESKNNEINSNDIEILD